MMRLRSFVVALAAFASAVVPTAVSASEVIAHRGVYHDTDTNQTLAENSFYAVVRAHDLGMRGVELDLRLSSDNTVLVTHDMISNRATVADNANGGMNAVDVALGLQSAPSAIHFSAHNYNFWTNVELKNYGRNARLIHNSTVTGDVSHLQNLDSLIYNLKSFRAQVLNDPNFMIVLDVQDPTIFKLAAGIIKKNNLGHLFYLKFFASKALYNTTQFSYNGADTCYVYAKANNLTGLNIIPQINDGELDIDEDDDAGINAFQTRLTPDQYLQCWADAQAQHADAAKMPIVSASVPADKPGARAAAGDAISWAHAHGRKTMTIVPNPDAGRLVNGVCKLYSFQSTNVAAAPFNMAARQAKADFAANSLTRPDYIVWDVMGDYLHRKYHTDFNTYTANLC
ncbi:glycerophosphodiester phosphodiesterase family protein [Sphingomonas sp. XXL09]|uniref:glycerophosphodiester phosphodiesterase family protein n=1 Tax=Sphingomonas sp. XXL09 TaxID=3457787 RepID=UPI00406BA550